MNELALFAGAGGGILGGHLIGWQTVCAVEWEPYAAAVLVARQNDGCMPAFPVWDDVRTFDGRPWRGVVDVVSGGFPCTDISVAGKGAGIDGERSGMWREMARIIGEVRPRFVFVENSPALTHRGGWRVSADLAAMGYVGCNGVLGAEDAIWLAGDPCADHERRRMWFRAEDSDADSVRELQPERGECDERRRICDVVQTIPDAYRINGQGRPADCQVETGWPGFEAVSWWRSEPGVCRVADGVAHRMDRLKAIGNGQVPAVVRLAWRVLTKRDDGDL